LLRAVSRGHDNELYVLLADLLELDEHLGPLLKAVRVARSRHHTVLVVCPWPAGLPPVACSMQQAAGSEIASSGKRAADSKTEQASLLSAADGLLPAIPVGLSAADLVRRMAHARASRAWRVVRRAFGRMRVPVLNATTGDPARLILHRLEQLRAVQGASRG
jgi:hypothetical protein